MATAERLVTDTPAALTETPTAGTGADVLFTFSFETYHDARYRGMMRPPDRLLQTLQSSPRVRRLLVVNPYRSWPSLLKRAARRDRLRFPATAERSLHQPLRWRRHDPVDIDEVRRTYRRLDAKLRRAAARRGLEHPHVITANPLIAAFVPFEWAASVTYFARDDWSSHYDRQAYWPAFDAAYAEMARSGRRVIAVSQQIIDRIGPTGPHAVVPNGVAEDEWVGSAPPEPAWLARIPHPRATYTGTLDMRLDAEGIISLAVSHPRLQIILLGPTTDDGHVERLRLHPNIHLPGRVGRAELVAVLRHSDVCLLAHRRMPLTEAMSPLKVYEYLAAGCPVVSVDLAPVRRLGDRVTITDTVEDFADVIVDVIAKGDISEDERLRFVAENSWARRHETMLDLALAADTQLRPHLRAAQKPPSTAAREDTGPLSTDRRSDDACVTRIRQSRKG
jgi:teichuronic acid biosynthesis glycosyltransferase TuaH